MTDALSRFVRCFTRPIPPSERHTAPPPLRPDDVVIALALFAFVSVVPLMVLS